MTALRIDPPISSVPCRPAALHDSDEELEQAGIELSDETRQSEEQLSHRFAGRVVSRVISNPRGLVRPENLEQSAVATGLSRRFSIPLAAAQERSREVFRILREHAPVTVASNVVRDPDQMPVSVSVITAREIRLSGARTLNEVLRTFVPGFFLVEDQDDVIAGFRGMAEESTYWLTVRWKF